MIICTLILDRSNLQEKNRGTFNSIKKEKRKKDACSDNGNIWIIKTAEKSNKAKWVLSKSAALVSHTHNMFFRVIVLA